MTLISGCPNMLFPRYECFLFRFSLTFPVRRSSRGSTTLRSAARIFIPKNEKPRRRRPELRSRKVGHFWGTGKPKKSHPSPRVRVSILVELFLEPRTRASATGFGKRRTECRTRSGTRPAQIFSRRIFSPPQTFRTRHQKIFVTLSGPPRENFRHPTRRVAASRCKILHRLATHVQIRGTRVGGKFSRDMPTTAD